MWVRILLPLQNPVVTHRTVINRQRLPLPTVLCQQQNNNGKNRNLRKRVLEGVDDESDLAHLGQAAELGYPGYGYYPDPRCDHLVDRPGHQKHHDGNLSTIITIHSYEREHEKVVRSPYRWG